MHNALHNLFFLFSSPFLCVCTACPHAALGSDKKKTSKFKHVFSIFQWIGKKNLKKKKTSPSLPCPHHTPHSFSVPHRDKDIEKTSERGEQAWFLTPSPQSTAFLFIVHSCFAHAKSSSRTPSLPVCLAFFSVAAALAHSLRALPTSSFLSLHSSARVSRRKGAKRDFN